MTLEPTGNIENMSVDHPLLEKATDTDKPTQLLVGRRNTAFCNPVYTVLLYSRVKHTALILKKPLAETENAANSL